jgi:hypothetical protein
VHEDKAERDPPPEVVGTPAGGGERGVPPLPPP